MSNVATPWITGWTADDPLRIEYVHVPRDAGRWVHDGAVERRDLGLRDATGGKMAVGHLRSAGGDATGESEWQAHDLDFQVLYVTAGELRVEAEDGTIHVLGPDGAIQLPALVRHRVLSRSADFEAYEITAPAVYETVVGRDAPLPERAATLDPDRAISSSAGGDDEYVMGAGPRKYFRYRDIGTRGPTGERIHLHVVRGTGTPGEGTGWHYHTMAQWFLILNGTSDIRVEDGRRIHLQAGDTMCIGSGPRMRHNVAPFSGDYAVLEMCVPAEYETIAVDPPEGAAA